jgi:hypothetical protein
MSEETSAPRRGGRPSDYTEELADEIVARLAEGEPLAVICRDEHMPCDDTVRNWARADEALSRDIARARVAGFDKIAWRSRLTLRGKTEEEGGESTGDVQRDKAIAEHDLKLLAKWDPKRYADRHVMVGGNPDEEPVRYQLDLSRLSDDQLAHMEAMLAQAGSSDAAQPEA